MNNTWAGLAMLCNAPPWKDRGTGGGSCSYSPGESSENHCVTSLFANRHSLQCNIIEFDLPRYTFGLHIWILALVAVEIHQMTVYGIGIYFLCIKLFCAISS